MEIITTKSKLTRPSGVLKDDELINGNKVLKNSFDDGALSGDYLTPWLKRAEQQRSRLS